MTQATSRPTTSKPVDHSHLLEQEVLDRYARGAGQAEAALCCPTDGYEQQYLDLLPQEIIEKDYGCGDPSKHIRKGEAVVDLGSGSGKICYILSQKVGPEGRVFGLDFNDAMLSLARKYHKPITEKLGFANVSFHKARIQDMALDLERVEQWLREKPIHGVDDLAQFESWCDHLRRSEPLVADNSVDAVVSNCVLNLVKPGDKTRLFDEIHRVLKPGGRAVIADVVCDEDPTNAILTDPKLWSGCISGAFREDRFLEMFEQSGFYGVEILSRADRPWQVIDGVEFRAMTVRAYKGKQGPCLERNQAVVYLGPWKQVRDDDGHVLPRGQRVAVCDKTYRILTRPEGPYAQNVTGIDPRKTIPLHEADPFDCAGLKLRDPRQTKGADYHATVAAEGPACCPDDGCC